MLLASSFLIQFNNNYYNDDHFIIAMDYVDANQQQLGEDEQKDVVIEEDESDVDDEKIMYLTLKLIQKLL